jgi:hypothetical protein
LVGQLVNVLNLNFKSTEPLGQEIVNRGENHEKNETENTGKDRSQKINNSDDSELVAAEDNHRNADESVDEAHQNIEGGHYLAGLEDGDADQLLFHSSCLAQLAHFIHCPTMRTKPRRNNDVNGESGTEIANRRWLQRSGQAASLLLLRRPIFQKGHHLLRIVVVACFQFATILGSELLALGVQNNNNW